MLKSSKTVIKVENLSKQYRLGLIGTGTLSDDLTRWWASIRGKEDPFLKVGEVNRRDQVGNSGPNEYVWALKDINFEVTQGEVLGIIGKNGAGKSTLLKILSRVTGPTTGFVKAKGRIASLLEVGTGFHPELTGKENIFLNGAILGMSKADIRRKLDEIINFSGVDKYIDTPVKRYSSGMYVRLAFAVAAHLDPEILIIDEVLAVGDAEFQKKCLGKMKDVAGEGRTVLFVSHNMAAVKNLCSRAILLRDGGISFEGDTHDVVSNYLDSGAELLDKPEILKEQIDQIASGMINKNFPSVNVMSIRVENEKGELSNLLYSNEMIRIKIAVDVVNELSDLRVVCELVDSFNTSLVLSQVSDTSEYTQYLDTNKISPGLHTYSCIIPPNMLSEKRYFITVQVINIKTEHIVIEKALYFDVKFMLYNNLQTASYPSRAFVRPLFEWEFD